MPPKFNWGCAFCDYADVASQSTWDTELVAHICGTSASVHIDDNFTLRMMRNSFVVLLGKLNVYLD